MKRAKIISTGIAAAIILGAGGPFLGAKEVPDANQTQKQLASSRNVDLAKQLNEAFIEVAEKVSPSVVVIEVTQKAGAAVESEEEDNPFFEFLPPEWRRRFFEERNGGGGGGGNGNGRRTTPRKAPVQQGRGSGIVVSEDGYILTNNHVVEGADTIKVRFRDRRLFDATVKGRDPQSDLAVIKIDAKGLSAAKLGDSAAARVGEFAIAIGAPFNLDYSVTIGHISAKGRSSVIPDPTLDQDFIQTDASINPGNSGGPLVNLYGEVIGINAMIRGLHTGIGFAIPSNLAKQVMNHLISEGKFVRSRIGVAITGLREDEDYKGLVPNLQDGVVIREINKNGPAAKSDLKTGDIVTAVDGHPVKTSRELKEEVAYKKPGQTITLDVVRDDKPLKIKVKTEGFADEETKMTKSGSDKNGEIEPSSYGLTVKPLTRELADQYGVDVAKGVIVTGVERDGPAWDKQVRPGDVITEVNRRSVTNVSQFNDVVKKSDPKKGIILNVISRDKGSSRLVVLRESN